jgi:DNA replicative helicase MCM subunit Mcm2 (Cdc46/Mcm family)
LGGWPRHLRLTRREPVLALWLHEAPRDVLDVLREAATRHVLRTFPGYGAIRDEIHVRVADVPLQDSLRHLTRVHLDGLVRVAGVVCIRCRGVCGPPTASTRGPRYPAGEDGTPQGPKSCRC